MPDGFCIESMMRWCGTTVTIFTASGGLSGSGFTGVLAGICDGCVKLITCIGAAPCCPLGSSCTGGWGAGFNGNWGGGFNGGWGGFNNGWGSFGNDCGCGFGNDNVLGSVVNIPINQIVGFVHNAV